MSGVSTTEFQPTRPLRGATCAKYPRYTDREISTHAPLAGRDEECLFWLRDNLISTHAPLAGRDVLLTVGLAPWILFQPTRPLRGATSYHLLSKVSSVFQPTRPLRGATW